MKKEKVFSLTILKLTFLSTLLIFLFFTSQGNAETYSDTKIFNPDEGKSWNTIWKHCLSQIPADKDVISANIEIRSQVWGWPQFGGWIGLCVSNSNVFYIDSQHCVIEFTPGSSGTHPSPYNFYTVSAPLTNIQLDWLNDDNCLDVILYTDFGGIYYLDYSMLSAVTGLTPKLGDINNDSKVDISDVILVLRCTLNLPVDPYQCMPCGDINKDGKVDISDVILTLRMALGLDPLRQCIE